MFYKHLLFYLGGGGGGGGYFSGDFLSWNSGDPHTMCEFSNMIEILFLALKLLFRNATRILFLALNSSF